jgi:hypothetical protein
MAKGKAASACEFDGHKIESLVVGSEMAKIPGQTVYTALNKFWVGCIRCGRTLDEIRSASTLPVTAAAPTE